jgi:hypothetical protein
LQAERQISAIRSTTDAIANLGVACQVSSTVADK